MADAPEGFVRLNIGLPLPLDVVTLTSTVLSKAWPGSKIDGNYSGGLLGMGSGVLSILIPEKEARRPRKVTAKAIEEARPEPTDLGPEWDGDVIGVQAEGEDGIVFRFGTPEALGNLLVQSCREVLAEQPEAANYLEWTMHEKDGSATYVLSVARSAGQTPHELRMKAERERDEALREVERANAAAVAAYDGNALIQQANAERDHCRDQIARVRELIEETPKSTRQRHPAVVAVEDLLHALDEDR